MNSHKFQHGKLRSTLVIVIASIVSVALGTMISATVQAQTAGAANVHVTISGPQQVKVGDIIHLRLQSDGNVSAAGFEALFLYSPDGAEFAGFAPALPNGEAGIGQLLAPQMATGSAVGYYTCATAPCLAQRSQQVQAAAEPGLLAEVELLALTPGQLEVKLAHLQMVDSNGQLIPIDSDPSTVVIQVGDGGPLLSAPTDPWTSTARAAAVVGVTAADITHDGGISHSDIMESAMSWETVHEAGQPCDGREANADINADGCVDIVDVQTTAARAAAQLNNDTATTAQATALTLTVNSTGDQNDSNVGDGICRTAAQTCTLRAAIQEANAITVTTSDLIRFAIPGGGVHTIQLASHLPSLHDEHAGTTIDGYSQPESVPNSDPLASNAQIRIEIRGEGYTGFDGLPITSAGNVVKGLAFFNLKRSLWIYGSGAHDNMITGDFLGTNAAGTFSASKTSLDQAHGLHMEQGAYQNHIGGPSAAERNVVSGNARSGIGLWHVGTENNVIINNIVGLRPDGHHRLHNRQQGIDMNYGAAHNIVGGTQPGERNVVSGNEHNGIEMTHGEQTTLNEIRGNFVGTDVTGEGGSSETGNGYFGISLHDRIENNLVAENVIGNNLHGGLLIDNFHTCCATDNKVENNWIGLSPGGTIMGNRSITEGVGVSITAMHSQIGPGNIIAYNLVGIQLHDDFDEGHTISNTITQNSIFSNTILGIDIAPLGQVNQNDPGDLDGGPNQQLNFPILNAASATTVIGSACALCRVELFIADRKVLTYGQGQTFAGDAVADASGAFTATLHNVKFGDYLTATATDPGGNTSEFSFNHLVNNPANHAPAAVDDVAVTEAEIPVTVDVITNDVDPEGDPLSIVAIGAAAHGDLTFVGPFVVYTPTAGFTGTEVFTYTASDNIGGSSVATVTITVIKRPTGTNGAGVIISPLALNLSLAGHPVTYTLVLESKPTADVTLTMHAGAPLSVTPSQLVFNANNWEQPQTVTVSIDTTAQLFTAQESVVRHSVESTDADYNNLGVPNLVVNITEGSKLLLPSLMR